jgi:apolipoprotein N-acyltransferase
MSPPVRVLLGLGAAVSTGCLLFLACADFDIWPLAWIGFLPALLAVVRTTPRRAFFVGWLAGIVANAGGFYWITLLLQRFGHMNLPLALFLFLLLVAYQGLHWGVFGLLVRAVRGRFPSLPMTLLAPVAMTSLELVTPFVFPWYIAITQAWVIPVIQVADLTGPLGVTFLLMIANGLLFDVVTSRLEKHPLPLRSAVAAAAVLLAALGYGQLRIHEIDARRAAARKVKIGLVQANIGIVEKGRRRFAKKHHELHLRETLALEREGAELVVWPESSYPYAFDRHRTDDYPEGHPFRVMQGQRRPLLFGTLTYSDEDPFPYNSAYMMEPSGQITGRFDKNYLLVFGEYIPFYEQFPSFRTYFPEASNFSRGTTVTTFPFEGFRIGPLICYEDIIPAFGRRLAALDPKPNLLVNITNDAWFGRTSEPWEHLALAVYRAVESRLDLVRSVNTGVSAFVDACGRLGKHTASYDPADKPPPPPVRLLGEAAMLEGADTFYAEVGDLFGWGNALFLAGLLVATWRRARAARRAVGPSTASPRRSKKPHPRRKGR